MKTVTMTEFNQRVSAVVRDAIDRGESVRVTNRGRVVLRLVPEVQESATSIDQLVASGLATGPQKEHRTIGKRAPVPLSRNLDDLIEEVSDDAGL
ncbi:type II toxin-antitoxin system Phd/YefM family antitoxin [Paramicrobacterium humi]|uniref:type II toxin-antitoxin system Phd/YefM family antitoxin n=1 Tax=Paramicrobacterium humi TaxID=640635 RepID=UPI000B80CA4C|nr:type II toxin-antitoxin system Phd/YefM family antitoxin [Microbacterium humi]